MTTCFDVPYQRIFFIVKLQNMNQFNDHKQNKRTFFGATELIIWNDFRIEHMTAFCFDWI